jgi:hypothetical protein
MTAKSTAASIFRDTRGSRSIEISVPGAFTAVGFSGQQKNPRASAAERGRPSLFKTIDEDRRERHDHINRSGRSTYPGRISVLTSGATPEWASRFGSIGPTLDVPIFDRGRWKAVRLYDVRAQEAALAYQRTVLNALREVENAIAAYGADQQRRRWLDATVTENRDALMLSRQRNETGLSNFIDVLDAERTLQQNQLSLAESTTAVTTDLVGLYRALGGGWQ